MQSSSYPVRFQLIMLDVIRPSVTYSNLVRPVSGEGNEYLQLIASTYQFEYDEKGDIKGGTISGPRVPDFKRAISYYIEDFPANKDINAFHRSPARDKVKIAYDYIWLGFKYEINSTATEDDIRSLSSVFNYLSDDIANYESIKRFIVAERESIFKRPGNGEGISAFVSFMDHADSILTLLSCLESVVDIIKNGLELLKTRLSQFTNIRLHELINSPAVSGFETYVKLEYRTSLMPYLIKQYTNKKPSSFVPMLYALEKLGIMSANVGNCNQTELHKALETSFGSIGERTSMNSALPLYHPDQADSAKKQKVEQIKIAIESFLGNS